MSAHATGSFEVKSWDERPYDEIEGLPKLTRASMTQVCHGDIEADMTIEYLMAYRDDRAATVLG